MPNTYKCRKHFAYGIFFVGYTFLLVRVCVRFFGVLWCVVKRVRVIKSGDNRLIGGLFYIFWLKNGKIKGNFKSLLCRGMYAVFKLFKRGDN